MIVAILLLPISVHDNNAYKFIFHKLRGKENYTQFDTEKFHGGESSFSQDIGCTKETIDSTKYHAFFQISKIKFYWPDPNILGLPGIHKMKEHDENSLTCCVYGVNWFKILKGWCVFFVSV